MDQIAIIAIFVALYSAFAGGFERTPVNGALVFAAFGLALGPFGTGILTGGLEVPTLRLIAELSLALVLFVEASKVDLATLRRAFAIPQRLILLALPVIILLGMLFGFFLLSDISLIGLAILATILAPTDAALGKAVVTNKAVPGEIREGLNFESGLNDGVCVPVFLAFLTIANGQNAGDGFGSILFKLLIQEIGIGAVVGIVVTVLVGMAVKISDRNGWIHGSWIQVPVAAAAIACFAAAQALHGSGFIAAFVGGLCFGILTGKDTDHLVHASEGTGDTFALLTWVLFGSALIGPSLPWITWEVVVYALISLTVVRMVPVFLALRGLPLTFGQKNFIGWFGPRGLATVVFAMMVLQSGLPDAKQIVAVATCVVVFSIIGHGMSALPIIRWMFGSAPETGEDKH
ncbi:MAG: sodium:proton antiporter [Rhodobacteraceae bacterium]|nr:sodium:proton antiporter [Paracoccaceae bacterium]